MADAGAGRHHAEIVERLRPPAEESVALGVASIFELDVLAEGVRAREGVDLDRMVDHEIDRHQRVDLARVAAQGDHRIAHRGEVDHGRDAREVLHEDARGTEGDLVLARPRLEPMRDGLEVGDRHAAPVLEAQEVLEQYLHRAGQPLDRPESLRGLGQGEVIVGDAVDLEGTPDAQTVLAGDAHEGDPSRRAQGPLGGGRPDPAETASI